jgi:hypothetical protein
MKLESMRARRKNKRDRRLFIEKTFNNDNNELARRQGFKAAMACGHDSSRSVAITRFGS